MARQTFSGVNGMSTWWWPKAVRASLTALAIAAVLEIVPASPMPLTPSGLWGLGVTVWSVSNIGRSSARGMLYSINEPVSMVPSSS